MHDSVKIRGAIHHHTAKTILLSTQDQNRNWIKNWIPRSVFTQSLQLNYRKMQDVYVNKWYWDKNKQKFR